MKNQRKSSIRIVELTLSKNGKCGRVKYNGDEPLPHEKRTIKCLSKYGFDIETVIPSNMPGSHNPDILMMGTFWEMKGPIGANEDTIEKRFRKAIKQANGKAVFDLRNIKNRNTREEANKIIMKLFLKNRGMRRLIIIRDSGKVLDIIK